MVLFDDESISLNSTNFTSNPIPPQTTLNLTLAQSIAPQNLSHNLPKATINMTAQTTLQNNATNPPESALQNSPQSPSQNLLQPSHTSTPPRTPLNQALANITAKAAFLQSHSIVLWDIVQSCDIVSSSDSNLKNIARI